MRGTKETAANKSLMKTPEFDKLVEYTISVIVDKESGGVESLERSIACFSAAIHKWGDGNSKKQTAPSQPTEKLFSFPWIAAVACLQEVDKFQKSMPIFV
jgi:hypothetical protein